MAEVFTVRLGGIERVVYSLSNWDAAPRKVVAGGRRVRPEGFTHQDKNVVPVTARQGAASACSSSHPD